MKLGLKEILLEDNTMHKMLTIEPIYQLPFRNLVMSP